MDPMLRALAGLVAAITLILPMIVVAAGASRVPEPGSPATRPIQEMPENMRRAMGCNRPAGPGTTHNANVTTPETWTEAGSPHLVLGRHQYLCAGDDWSLHGRTDCRR